MKRYRINWMLLLALAAGSVLLGAGTYFLHGYQVLRNSGALLARSQEKQSAGDVEEAVKLLKMYLRYNPDNDDQLVELATLLMKHVQATSPPVPRVVREAANTAETALRKKPENHDLRGEYASFLVQFGDHKLAAVQFEELATRGGTLSPAQRVRQSAALYATAKSVEAYQTLGKLVGYLPETQTLDPAAAEAPHEVDAYALLASMLLRDVKTDVAEQVVNQMVQANPTSFQAHLKRAQFLLSLGPERKAQAASDINRALALVREAGSGADETPSEDQAREEADVLWFAASLLLDDQTKSTQEESRTSAMALLNEGLKKFPKDSRFYRLGAHAHQLQGRTDEALKLVAEGLKTLTKADSGLLMQRVQLELGQKDYVAADKTLRELAAAGGTNPLILDYLRAQMLVAQGKWLDARQKLVAMREQVVGSQLDIKREYYQLLLQCHDRLQSVDELLTVYRDLLALDTANIVYRAGEVLTLERLNRSDESRTRYASLRSDLTSDNMAPLSTGMLRSLFEVELRHQTGRERAERDRKLLNTMADQLVGRTGVAESDVVALKARVAGLDSDAPTPVAAAQDTDPKLESLQRAIAKLNRNSSEEERGQVERELADYRKEQGDVWLSRVLQGAVLVATQDAEANTKLAQLASEGIEGYSAAERRALWTNLAQQLLRSGDTRGARSIYQRILAQDPSSINTYFTLLQLAVEANDELDAQAVLESLKKAVGDTGPEYQLARARIALWQMSLGTADGSTMPQVREWVAAAQEARPNWGEAARTWAHLLMAQRDQLGAIEALQRSLELNPGDVMTARSLFALLVDLQRFDEAGKALEQIPESQRLPAERQLVQVFRLLSGEKIQLEMVEDPATTANQWLLIGKLLANGQKFDEAEKAVRLALKQAPQDSNTWLTLVQLLVAKPDIPNAIAAAREAQLQLVERDAPLVIAACYELIDDRPQTMRFFSMAENQEPDSPRVLRAVAAYMLKQNQGASALPYLDRLIAGRETPGENAGDHQAWARRSKALVLASTRRYQDFKAALKLLDANAAKVDEMQPADSVVYSGLCLEGAAETRQMAIDRLVSIRNHRPLIADEQLNLAKLYEASNKWPECEALMLDLVAKRNDDARLLILWIDWQMKRARLDQAQGSLDRLSKLAPNSDAYQERYAEWLIRKGAGTEVKNMLKRMFTDATKSKDRNYIMTVARFTEKLAQYDASLHNGARKIFEMVAKSDMAGRLELAAYLARIGGKDNAAEAIRICEQAVAESKDDPKVLDAAVQISISAVRKQTPPEPEAYPQVDAWLQQLAGVPDQAPSLAGLMNQWLEMKGQVDQLEKHYREALDRLSSNSTSFDFGVAANNLAYLLALKGKVDEASQLIEKSIEILGPMEDLLDTRAMVYLGKQQPDKARDVLLRLVDYGADAPGLYFHLALAYQALGDKENATRAMDQAMDKGFTASSVNPLERLRLEKLQQELNLRVSDRGVELRSYN